MLIKGFRNLLLSDDFDIINPTRRVYQDMTRYRNYEYK
jgi:hypothetical protein